MYQINFSHPIHIYFIGIGGISMSGLAEVLLEKNFRVSGSDRSPSPLTRTLEEKGVRVFYGQEYRNITKDIDLIVYTSAVHPDNPELVAAGDLCIPVLTRAQLLGQLMKNYDTPIAVAGTHGKTTTTSMLAEILLEAGADPTVSVGGMLKSINGNIRVGHSGCFLTEACEYTNSFLSFYPKYGVILNVEEDHMDFFKDIDDILHSFHLFASLLPAEGALVINASIPGIHRITEGISCPVITFGNSGLSDYHPENIRYDEKGCASFSLIYRGREAGRYSLSVPGEHNIYNAMAAIALCRLLSIDPQKAGYALSHFSGTDRRFEYKGSYKGVTIIDDYAHHPTEITATLKAAANYPHNTLWCIFQPHTYTRTKTFMKDFAKALTLADQVILAKIFPARETDDLGISSATLRDEITALGKKCFYFETFEEIKNFVSENCKPGDLLITMGAGDVVRIGDELLQ